VSVRATKGKVSKDPFASVVKTRRHDNNVLVSSTERETRFSRAMYGTGPLRHRADMVRRQRSAILKELEIHGRRLQGARSRENMLESRLAYSHAILLEIPAGIRRSNRHRP